MPSGDYIANSALRHQRCAPLLIYRKENRLFCSTVKCHEHAACLEKPLRLAYAHAGCKGSVGKKAIRHSLLIEKKNQTETVDREQKKVTLTFGQVIIEEARPYALSLRQFVSLR